MSRFLYLMRHAQSTDKQFGQTDKERELTAQGMNDARLAGKYLSAQKIILELLVSSTAIRASQTATLVAQALKPDSIKIQLTEELYTAVPRTFLEIIHHFDETYHHIMCVGHNPVISYLAEYLTEKEIGDMPPAGIAMIKCRATSWREVNQGFCEVIAMVTPDNFKS
ncbi:MAG: phosphohistidine phosphatase SixA [Cyclobacteriaceae bacterium]